jgi:cysteine desulfurase/selenocysteine lyase
MIYADNAATSYPKPHEILLEMVEVYESLGVSPGRGSYDLSVKSEELVNQARQQVCSFFGGGDPSRVAFTYNATDALNLLIQGLIEPGCHVVTSRLEHNSVLRPLHHFSLRGEISIDLLPFGTDGFIDIEEVERALRLEPRFVILTHGSNALGTIQPVEEIAALCAKRKTPLILDVTQTAGLVPITMKKWGVSAIAFTGHKALYGPTGIGGLVLDSGLDVRSTRFGGTGMNSNSLVHSQSYPERLEAGTINMLGVIGLSAGIRSLGKVDLHALYSHEMLLTRQLVNGLASLERVQLYCVSSLDSHLPIVLFNVKGMSPEQVSAILDGDFGIATRAGLHCTPLVHQDLGTLPYGAVRISLGRFNTAGEIDKIIEAVNEICRFKAG